MPAFNVEQYLAQSVDSVLGSAYPNLELVIVDDGSKDCRFEIAKSYEA